MPARINAYPHMPPSPTAPPRSVAYSQALPAEPQSVKTHSAVAAGGRRAVPSWLGVLLAITLVAVVYIPVLEAPFLWDDRLLLETTMVQRLHAPWLYFLTPFWDRSHELAGAGLFYRPLVVLSFALDHALHQNNPAGYHLTNLVLHLVTLYLLVGLVRRQASSAASVLLTVGWALAPRLSESVAWISGRTDGLCALLTLASLVCYAPGSIKRLCGATSLALAAAFSKESGVVALLCLGLAAGLQPRSRRHALLPLIALGGYLLLRQQVLTIDAAAPLTVPLTAWERSLTVLEATGRYLQMILNPWQPVSQAGLLKAPDWGFVAAGAMALLAALALGLRFGKHVDRTNAPLLLLCVAPLLLVIHVLPLPWITVAADRVLYLPAAALTILVARPFSRALEHWRWLKFAAPGFVASLTFACAGRVARYTDEVEFWIAAVESATPGNWGPALNLADEFTQAGLFEPALELVHAATRHADPTGLQTSLQHELLPLMGLGRYRDAWARLERDGQQLAPAQRWLALGQTRAQLGELDASEAFARHALEASPRLDEAQALLRQLECAREQQVAVAVASGAQRLRHDAELQLCLGRVPETARAWAALWRDPQGDASAAARAAAFLIAFADRTSLKQVMVGYRSQPHAQPGLLHAFSEREAAAQRLLNALPRIQQALASQSEIPGR